MSVATMQIVTDHLREEAWKLYVEAFDPLRRLAVQRHVMYGDEFEAVMADPRAVKYLVFDDRGALHGLATLTNDVHSVPLVSPEWFAHRWPERFSEGRVFYIGFVGIHPHSQGSGVCAELVEAMTREVAKVDGVAVLDVCRYNRETMHLPRLVAALSSTWASHVEMIDLDAQSYIGYDFKRAG
ncbi:MAG: GNAT family N-acetyltransferase [Sporichthyaceae bacterium]